LWTSHAFDLHLVCHKAQGSDLAYDMADLRSIPQIYVITRPGKLIKNSLFKKKNFQVLRLSIRWILKQNFATRPKQSMTSPCE
jgi:hypothetical protein